MKYRIKQSNRVKGRWLVFRPSGKRFARYYSSFYQAWQDLENCLRNKATVHERLRENT